MADVLVFAALFLINAQEQNAVLRLRFFFGSAGQDRFLSKKEQNFS